MCQVTIWQGITEIDVEQRDLILRGQFLCHVRPNEPRPARDEDPFARNHALLLLFPSLSCAKHLNRSVSDPRHGWSAAPLPRQSVWSPSSTMALHNIKHRLDDVVGVCRAHLWTRRKTQNPAIIVSCNRQIVW